MKTALLLAPLAALSLLVSGCHNDDDDHGCDPQPRCVSGTLLRHTCMAGSLIQLDNSQEGQTIQFDFDGSGVKTYHHVISTRYEPINLVPRGGRLYFTLTKGGQDPRAACLAYDAPSNIQVYTVSNVSAAPCDGDVRTQSK